MAESAAPPSTKPTASQLKDDRASLSSRVIPLIKLSTETNPLTAPLGPSSTTNPQSLAAERFTVEGNAIITGGAGTLGLASAMALLQHGASNVALFDLQPTLTSSEASKSIDSLKSTFPNQVHCFAVDVTSSESIENAVLNAASKMGSVDILCCFAGIVGCVPSISVTADQFRKVIDVNLTGSFLCAQSAARQMIEQNTGGSILFTASISAHHTNFPQPQTAYNVSKAAVKHMTTNLAAEWAVHGIRVNCISPGYMDTILNAGDNLKAIREIWAAHNPMGRMGAVEEITAPVVMLCSKRAGRYINGADILVDGGAMSL